MPAALVLHFDEAAEVAVRDVRDRLTAEGLVAPDEHYRPHVSLWGTDAHEPFVPAALSERLRQTRPFDIALGSMGLFAGAAHAVFLAPLPNATLGEVQAAAWESAVDGDLRPRPYYRPEIWVPHCTLALQVPPDRLAGIAGVVAGLSLPITGTVRSGALVDTTTGATIAEVALSE